MTFADLFTFAQSYSIYGPFYCFSGKQLALCGISIFLFIFFRFWVTDTERYLKNFCVILETLQN